MLWLWKPLRNLRKQTTKSRRAHAVTSCQTSHSFTLPNVSQCPLQLCMTLPSGRTTRALSKNESKA